MAARHRRRRLCNEAGDDAVRNARQECEALEPAQPAGRRGVAAGHCIIRSAFESPCAVLRERADVIKVRYSGFDEATLGLKYGQRQVKRHLKVAEALHPDVSPDDLGLRIRAYRQMRKLTLRQVAERSEVSVSFLSQLERGTSGASIPTLRSIAEALGLSLSDLFSAEPTQAHRVLRAAERPTIQASGVDKFLLTRRPLQHLEVLEGVVQDGAMVGNRSHRHGDSQELLLVLDGSVRLILDDREHVMDRGDSIEYRSSSTHCVVNDSGTTARVLWIISPPSL
jgi:transcriptional regulator with XRE-family HTH domain